MTSFRTTGSPRRLESNQEGTPVKCEVSPCDTPVGMVYGCEEVAHEVLWFAVEVSPCFTSAMETIGPTVLIVLVFTHTYL